MFFRLGLVEPGKAGFSGRTARERRMAQTCMAGRRPPDRTAATTEAGGPGQPAGRPGLSGWWRPGSGAGSSRTWAGRGDLGDGAHLRGGAVDLRRFSQRAGEILASELYGRPGPERCSTSPSPSPTARAAAGRSQRWPSAGAGACAASLPRSCPGTSTASCSSPAASPTSSPSCGTYSVPVYPAQPGLLDPGCLRRSADPAGPEPAG